MSRFTKSPDGMIHTVPLESKKAKERTREAKDADVCLNCKQKKCLGTTKCVERNKKEKENESD